MSKIFTPFIASSMMLLTGCATIVNGTRQNIAISSNPANADIWVDNQYVGQTPRILQLSRKDNHFVRLEIDGYRPYELTFSRDMSLWVFGNIAFGGFIGLAVDAVSGGLYKLNPEQVQAQIGRDLAYSKKTDDSFIAVVLEVDPTWEKIGQLERS